MKLVKIGRKTLAMPVQKSMRRQRLMLYCIHMQCNVIFPVHEARVISDIIAVWMEENIGRKYYDWDLQRPTSSHSWNGNTVFSFRDLEGKVKFILRWM